MSGKSIEKDLKKFNKKLKASEIFSNYRKSEKNSLFFINEYKDILSRCLVTIITTMNPDAIVLAVVYQMKLIF